GAVSVYAAYIDPSAQDIYQTVPGSFLANDKDGRRVQLTSYGMLAVELEGSNGQKLQVKTGQSATLTTAIPTAAQASAPASIPMWYVDETTGIWKEEGSATKVGNSYVGNVPHFSFWNCDVPSNNVSLHLTLKNGTGAPLQYVPVRITRTRAGWSTSSYGWTDSLGQVAGGVPANEQLVLEVITSCGAPVYTQNIGPFTTATTIPSITVNIPAANMTTLTGSLLNCAGAPVTNGFVIVVADNLPRFATVDTTGHFSLQMIACSPASGNIELTGIDNATQTQSSLTTVPNATGNVNAGVINVCGLSTTEFLDYRIDSGATVHLVFPPDSLYFDTAPVSAGSSNWQSIVTFNGPSSSRYFYMNFMGSPAPGSNYLNGFGLTGYTPNNDQVFANVTIWPTTIGSYMVGTISGFFSSGGAQHSITGNFRVRRNQ
ncbi:MAG: hypothetical protein EOP50_11085, partial [Sphingobacteriales bacterium]